MGNATSYRKMLSIAAGFSVGLLLATLFTTVARHYVPYSAADELSAFELCYAAVRGIVVCGLMWGLALAGGWLYDRAPKAS